MIEESERAPQEAPKESKDKHRKNEMNHAKLDEQTGETEKVTEEEEQGVELMNHLINSVLYKKVHRVRLAVFEEICPTSAGLPPTCFWLFYQSI